MNEAAIRDAVHRADNAPGYPEAVRFLIEGGVKRYHTDVATRTIVYSSDAASYSDLGVAPAHTTPEDAGGFDGSGVEAAFTAVEQGRSDYSGFLGAIWAAGVVEYDVDLVERRITYRGRHGETYVQRIPLPE